MLDVSWWCIFEGTVLFYFILFFFFIWDFFKDALGEHSSQISARGSQMAHVLSFNLLLKGPSASFSSVELVTAAACKSKSNQFADCQ